MFNIPLPEFNTGIGFHYFPDETHYRAKDAQAWVPELKALGASWLTVRASPERAIPESFLRPLIEAGIEPIIHVPLTPIRPIDEEALTTLYRSYARWGAHYVVLYDQPNRRSSWAADHWSRESLVNRFLDLLLPGLQLAHRHGLVPVFPPLAQGGDYWDTSFLDAAINLLQKRGQAQLLKEMVFAVNGFASNRPVEWGAGGAARWTTSQPYTTPPGSQDQRGFRAFEWYAEIIRARLGDPRPLLMLAGGAVVGDSDEPIFPQVDPLRHALCNMAIARAARERTLPTYLTNVSFWLLASEDDDPHAAAAWYRGDGSTLAVVGELKKLAAAAVQTAAAAARETPRASRPATAPNGHKPIYHYVLLPTFEWGISDWHWSAALDYVRKFQPACGFSVAEAQAAKFVTIVGNEQGISAAAEDALRAAGCAVERVQGRDGSETWSLLRELANTGKRFATLAD